jgi:hypothetical protein
MEEGLDFWHPPAQIAPKGDLGKTSVSLASFICGLFSLRHAVQRMLAAILESPQASPDLT